MLSNSTNFTFFITIHLADLTIGSSIDINVVVVVKVLIVLTVDSIVYSFIFIIVTVMLAIVSDSCMIWLHVLQIMLSQNLQLLNVHLLQLFLSIILLIQSYTLLLYVQYHCCWRNNYQFIHIYIHFGCYVIFSFIITSISISAVTLPLFPIWIISA